jgi:D-alanyl-D-alanine carboxypeptidase
VPITRAALAFQGSGVGVLPLGKRVSLRAMLYGLMLPSGNDAAIALAQRVSGTVPRFVRLMNVRAADLGLGCTRFSSPDGFNDRHNYSCAADLAVLAHADLRSRRLARVVGTRSVVVPFPIKGGKLFLYNNNPLLLLGYPGLTGLKTGYTQAAGPCLVATAARHGVRLGVVLLNSPNPAEQALVLLDRAYARVYHQRLPARALLPSLPAPPRRAARTH